MIDIVPAAARLPLLGKPPEPANDRRMRMGFFYLGRHGELLFVSSMFGRYRVAWRDGVTGITLCRFARSLSRAQKKRPRGRFFTPMN
jgi:hypothetical protein